MALLKRKKEAVSAAGPVPLVDEIEQLGNSIMAKVERSVEDNLRQNLPWTVTRMVRVLQIIGTLTLGRDDKDVRRVSHNLSCEGEALLQQILDNPDEIKRRMARK